MRYLRSILRHYFRGSFGLGILTVSFFLAGIVFGALMIRFLGVEQLGSLQTSLNTFLQDLKPYPNGNLEPYRILKASYRKNISYLALTCFLGLFRLGFPLVLFTLLLKGLALGFTAGFLVYNYTLKGLLLSLAALLPHNIVLVPAFLLAAAIATAYSFMGFREKAPYKKPQAKSHFNEYCFYMFLSALLILAGGLVEAYLSPVFMRLFVSFFF